MSGASRTGGRGPGVRRGGAAVVPYGTDLLPRLTGRIVKGRQSRTAGPYQPRRGTGGTARTRIRSAHPPRPVSPVPLDGEKITLRDTRTLRHRRGGPPGTLVTGEGRNMATTMPCAGRRAARHPHPAGSVPARRRGEVRGPLEGGRRRLLRTRRPAVTVQRLAELADFYGVPVEALLPDARPAAAAQPPPKLVIDLERLGRSRPRRPAPWRTRRRSRASAATTTARCCRSAPTTCGHSR